MTLYCSKKTNSIIKKNNINDFCCVNCLHSFRTKNKLESHKKVCQNKDFFNIAMPFKIF